MTPTRAITAAIFAAALLLPGGARAQLTQKCEGQSWAQLAGERYGDARLAKVLAIYNRAEDPERCTPGRFVRFLATVRHGMKLGQTLEQVVGRFLRGDRALAHVRAHNRIPRGAEPKVGQQIEIPAELAIPLGSRPEAELAEIPGLPELALIREYNAEKGRFTKGGTIYVPLYLELKPKAEAPAPPPPPPAPPPVAAPEPPAPPPAPPPAATSTAADEALSFAQSRAVPKLERVLAVPAEARPIAFLHQVHRPLLGEVYRCETCHPPDPRRPGAFLPISVALCAQCHATADADAVGPRPLRLPLIFAHALHLDPERAVAKGGYRLECSGCHAAAEGPRRGQPGHAECGRCHNGIEAKPAIDGDCAACHGTDEEPDRLAQAIALLDEHLRGGDRHTDVRFSHRGHVAWLGREGGEEAACLRCHQGAREAESLDQIEPQRMADCLNCHRGMERTLGEEVIALDRCRTCHLATMPQLAPSFGAVVEKPISHSPLFRRRHAEEAAGDRGVCSACHLELARGDGAECDRCHQQMRPRDHGARWREEPHGHAASRDPDRCATCHLRDRCADCHAQPPRDHFPRTAFRLLHARSARISVRRCMTCHVPDVDCADCHDTLR